MIARLRGVLVDLAGTAAIVDVGGVGYEVLMPDSVALQMPSLGGDVELWIRHVFREDGQSLYGFSDLHQRRVFDLLTDVKGCGPKIALSLLGHVGEESIVAAILNQEGKVLSRASGVGPRLADRILLELKDKIQEEALRRKIEPHTSQVARLPVGDEELVDALLALGYRRQEAEHAAGRVEGESIEVRLREALKLLAR